VKYTTTKLTPTVVVKQERAERLGRRRVLQQEPPTLFSFRKI
jgi:hypothetical protein